MKIVTVIKKLDDLFVGIVLRFFGDGKILISDMILIPAYDLTEDEGVKLMIDASETEESIKQSIIVENKL